MKIASAADWLILGHRPLLLEGHVLGDQPPSLLISSIAYPREGFPALEMLLVATVVVVVAAILFLIERRFHLFYILTHKVSIKSKTG